MNDMKESQLSQDKREKGARARSFWIRGYQAQMDGQVEKAVGFYRESLQTFPTAEAHTFLGWAYSNQGDLEGAIRECRKAIAVDPAFGNPYNDIGAYYIEQEKWEEAVPWLKKAIQSERYEPRHFPHFNLGRVYLRQGKVQDALEQFQKALDQYPGYLPARQFITQIEGRFN